MFDKKIIALMICAALPAAVLSGCGSSESDLVDDVVIDFEAADVDDAGIGANIEAVEPSDASIDFHPSVPELDFSDIEAVEPSDVSIDFNPSVPELDFSDIEAVEAADVTIDFDIPEFDLDFSDIVPVEPVEYEPSFTLSHPELDFSDIEMAQADDSAVIKGIKYSFADNVYSDDYEAINAMDEEELIDITERKFSLLADLGIALEKAGINVEIDEISGEVTLDSAILFGFDSNEVSKDGKAFLSKFAAAYSSVVLDEKYSGFIKQILVEGHTDTNGTYEYNLALSEERAANVMNYCISEVGGELGGLMKAIGFSYNDPIYAADGSVDAEASRRVAFRFIVNIE